MNSHAWAILASGWAKAMWNASWQGAIGIAAVYLICRAETGGAPAIWVMDSDGKDQRKLTSGFNNLGADHPLWSP